MRMLCCKKLAQVQDTAVAMGINKENWKDEMDGSFPSDVLERSTLESEAFLSSTNCVPDSSFQRLDAELLARSCSQNEIAKFNQHGCFSRIWNNVMLQCLHFLSVKQSFYTTLYTCSIRNSKRHRGRSLPVKAITSEDKTCEAVMYVNPSLSWRCFTYEEISLATNYFNPDNVVGRGGYADVYKGILPNGEAIAVKRLFQEGTNKSGREEEFLEEIGIMGHLCHPNVMPLIGFCLEDGLYFVFPFYSLGSLFTLLHGNQHHVLDWGLRFKIALGTAKGIQYLHSSCQRRIIHRDIKASNILIGSDFEPHISDFGLAKWLPTNCTQFSLIPVEGTFGYIAPEYLMHGIVDEKTDVFAFGVLLLEIISGRRPIDASQQSLVLWARQLLDSGNVEALVDSELRGAYDVNQMQIMIVVAAMCISQVAISRPSMSQVLQILTEGNCSNSPIC